MEHSTKRIYSTNWLSLFERSYLDKKGNEKKWVFASRSEQTPNPKFKTPDAVIVVAITENGELVLTDELRIPIGCRELGFPAGLIEEWQSVEEAGIREFKEETGMDLEVVYVSPPNLYSSAGMTDESVQFVFGNATGTPTTEFQEDSEDIKIELVDQDNLYELCDEKSERALGAKAFPIMLSIARGMKFHPKMNSIN